uniref:Uncharacterized protein n=1 Tax=Sphaerodactylus townsendi TaxID=933632 RepID=A0ACB8EU56_9SAUR
MLPRTHQPVQVFRIGLETRWCHVEENNSGWGWLVQTPVCSETLFKILELGRLPERWTPQRSAHQNFHKSRWGHCKAGVAIGCPHSKEIVFHWKLRRSGQHLDFPRSCVGPILLQNVVLFICAPSLPLSLSFPCFYSSPLPPGYPLFLFILRGGGGCKARREVLHLALPPKTILSLAPPSTLKRHGWVKMVESKYEEYRYSQEKHTFHFPVQAERLRRTQTPLTICLSPRPNGCSWYLSELLSSIQWPQWC